MIRFHLQDSVCKTRSIIRIAQKTGGPVFYQIHDAADGGGKAKHLKLHCFQNDKRESLIFRRKQEIVSRRENAIPLGSGLPSMVNDVCA